MPIKFKAGGLWWRDGSGHDVGSLTIWGAFQGALVKGAPVVSGSARNGSRFGHIQ